MKQKWCSSATQIKGFCLHFWALSVPELKTFKTIFQRVKVVSELELKIISDNGCKSRIKRKSFSEFFK